MSASRKICWCCGHTAGHANSVAVALDQADWPEITGTIAGDDTILVVAPDAKTAEALKARFLKVLK